ncbi:Permease of the drug/metabolite transporter (DMT) superfamily [Rhizobiales bacterium GAS191]|jgi:drug/metabolite transporter (DMT)-like permease|nr:Permease of the drug/metabolite transporter (DMT) superfamily [Rhizobiales bacterium GAS113]SED53948.1 Permease of the drug/metabolite transporter (DMT) superfamily [Rhizobiales bacterium GAS188]SEE89962.1 Permease of the drug/metabolite transporter (DMT) superfamily [Rhizobiales bacterium GAS191]
MANGFSRAMTRFNNQPYLLIGLSTLMWGGNVVAGRLAVGQISPMAITCLRWFIVCAIFSLTIRGRLASEWPLIAPHWRKLAILGATGFTLFNSLFYVAAQYTTAVNMAVLQGTFPALVLVGMALVFKAPVSLLQTLGILVTFGGVAIIACHGELATLLTLTFNRGDLLLLIGTVIFAGYTIALRDRPKASAIVIFAALAASAFITSIPFLAVEMALGQTYLPTLKGLLVLSFIAIGPSLLGQIFFIRGIELMGPSRTGIFYNLVPVFGALLAVAILGEHFHPYHAVAFVLVLGGIWLSERAPPAPLAATVSPAR